MIRVHVLFVAVAAALLWIAGCASEPRIEDALSAPATVVVVPVENRSGVDLRNLPGLVWESSEIMRLLLELESAEAPLAQWPFANVEPGEFPEEVAADSVLRSQLRFDPERGVLTWRETMLREDRERLQALSDDPLWRESIELLYAHSRRDRHDVLAMLQRELAAELGRCGATAATLADEALPAGLTYRERIDAARAATGAELALVVVLERWEASELFDKGEIRVRASAALVDSTTRQLRWGPRTAELRLRPAGEHGNERLHGVVDMRGAFATWAEVMAAMLLEP